MKKLAMALLLFGCSSEENITTIKRPKMCDAVELDADYFLVKIRSVECSSIDKPPYRIIQKVNGYVVRVDGVKNGI